MKRTLIAAVVLCLLTSSLALADPPWEGGDHGNHHDWRHDHDRRDHDRGEHRGWRRDDARRDHWDGGEYRRPPGYYRHVWERGDRLPIAFRAPAYIVPAPAVYHLAPPPPGYYWVRVDNNAVLAAIATGVVLSVVFNQFR